MSTYSDHPSLQVPPERSAVIALDTSMSMPMRDVFEDGRSIAAAIHDELVQLRPGAFVAAIAFSEAARAVTREELGTLGWDFVYGTNLQHAVDVAVGMIGHRLPPWRRNPRDELRRVIVITDSDGPDAHMDANGDIFFAFPRVPESEAATVRSLQQASRLGLHVEVMVLHRGEPPGTSRDDDAYRAIADVRGVSVRVSMRDAIWSASSII